MKEYRTACRRDIDTYLETRHDMRFSAADVMQYLEEIGRPVNQATVYRNLDKMTELGILMKSRNPSEDCSYYQYMHTEMNCEGHLHFQCRKCGKVIHLEDNVTERFYRYIQSNFHVALDFKDSMITGLCEDCR